LEHEIGFLRYLKQSKIKPNEYEFPENKLANMQEQFVKLIERNYYLNCSAKDGYRSYLQAYASHKQRDIFDVNQIDLAKMAYSFGLSAPPRVNLNVKVQGRTVRKNKLKEQLGKRSSSHF
jgi:ATP-dependent RNA helicase DDX18/HAS1